jgi:hypothetical protein
MRPDAAMRSVSECPMEIPCCEPGIMTPSGETTLQLREVLPKV